MSVDVRAEEITSRERAGSWRLWFGLLAAPIAWTIELIVNYSLEEWFACAPSTRDEGRVLGLSVDTVAVLITSVLAAVALAGLLVSLACRRGLQETDDGHIDQRARWMALAGIFNSVLYLVIILVSFGPPALLDACRTSP
jgi:hypothetical protein